MVVLILMIFTTAGAAEHGLTQQLTRSQQMEWDKKQGRTQMEPKIRMANDKVKIIVNQRLLDHCESEISGSLVRDFCTAIEYGRVPEFVGRLRNTGHRLIARWGEEILLETSSDQRTCSSISGWEQWQLQ